MSSRATSRLTDRARSSTPSSVATAPAGRLSHSKFKEAGTQAVSTDWTLGDARTLPHYEGWQALQVFTPNEMESSREMGSFRISCTSQGSGNQPKPNGQQPPGPMTSKIVLDGFQQAEKDWAARAEARKQLFEAERARYEPTAMALAKALKAGGVDLDGYLSASKQFVELPPEKINQGEVDRINKKFAEPIHSALARIVGVPGIADILRGAQSPPASPGPPPPGQQTQGSGSNDREPQAAACCSTARFEPPFDGLYREFILGASSTRPGEVRQLSPNIRSAIASAPHMLEASGRIFTVPSNARHVRVTVNLGTNWVIGLSGVGYSHVWLGLDMRVYDSRTALVCSAPHLQQDNQWTWTGGSLTLSDHRPGPVITRTCVFDRNPGDPTEYGANVFASTDGTFVGFSGGYGAYYVDLGPVDVTSCP